MKIKAFTFIELLVVTAILILVSSSGVFYFFGFLDQTKLNSGINYVKDELKTFDKNIKSRDILNYEIFLKKDSLFFIVKENTINLDNILVFSGTTLDFYTGSGTLYLEPTGDQNQAIKLDIYANGKFLKDFIIKGDGYLNYGFSRFQNYKISGTYSGQILNNIKIKYFTESNLDHKKEDYLKLVKISTDKNNNLDNIKIINILGRKRFSDSYDSSKLFLTFDVNGKQKTLEINK